MRAKRSNLVLIGFMGTGKTSTAKALAKRLKMDYVDLDDLIEESESMKISDIFAQKEESYFREVEAKVIREAVDKIKNTVIATGGGCVLRDENIENLKKMGPVILVSARPEVILERTKKYTHRPLLEVEDPMKKINELLEYRAPYYAKADFEIDTSDLGIEQVIELICQKLKL